MKFLLLALLTGCADSIQEFECEDRDDMNRGGSVHVVGPAERGVVVDAVWCGDDDTEAGFECEDRDWWLQGVEMVVDCPVVEEDQDRGWLWVRVGSL